VFGFLAALVFFLPPYAGAFGLLAFLPRWRWLLPAALLAAVACILVGRKLSMQDARFGPGLDVLLLITIGFGFIAGFVARALLLITRAYRPLWARPKLILPITFAVTPLVLVGLIKILGS
jgi:hypothetical protein